LVFLVSPVETLTTSAETCEWIWFVSGDDRTTVAVSRRTEPIGTGFANEISSRALFRDGTG
jgi:hypothetical protein